jgi:uncharacterized RDD family membrane protein YckC
MPWYYEKNRQQIGPVSDEEFASLVQAGTIAGNSLVWRDGWANWQPYSSVAAQTPLVGATGSSAAMNDDTAICAVSGRRLPKRDMLEYEGRWVSAEHKEEFFQRLREGVTQPGNFVYASFGRRFGAKFIDGLILWVVNMIIGALTGAAMGAIMLSGGDPTANTAAFVIIQLVSTLIGMAMTVGYSLYFIRKQDATPGKKMLGLKVLRADGAKLSKGRIVGRYFAEIVSSLVMMIGYLMAAFDKEQRRALHDRMCDTRVIDVRLK